MKARLKSRWREATWIDLMFTVDHAGEKVNFDKYSQTDQRLAGIRGRTNSYLAHWVPSGGATDEAFLAEIKHAWNDLSGFLNGHRALNN